MSNAVLGRVSIQSSAAAAWYPVPDLQVRMRYDASIRIMMGETETEGGGVGGGGVRGVGSG